jgi:hypothetical protein
MERTLLAGLSKQQEYQRQATPVYEEALARSSPAAAQRQIEEESNAARTLYGDTQGGLPLTSPLELSPLDKVRVVEAVKQRSVPLATLQGLRGYGARSAVADLDTNINLNAISGLARSSAQSMPYLLQAASQSGAGLAGIGSLMSTAGMLAGIYGAIQPAGLAALPKTAPGTTLPASTLFDNPIG